MAYKKDDNGGQAAVSAAPSGGSSGGGGGNLALSSGGSKAAVKESSSGAGKSYSIGKASAKASSSGQGKVYSGGPVGGGGSSGGSMGESLFSKSVSAGSRAKKGTTASFDAAMSPAWVGKNPYQWGNTSTIVNHWDDRDPERQAKLNALGFAADDPDRTFHFYEPDKGSPKSYLDQANALSSDRNYYQAGNFWNTINGSYASEEDRVSDAMEWMKDAQIYGKWAKDHDLTYTDENGEEKSMEEAWKEIWSYANDIAGGIGDSDSTRAQKDIQSYLTGGEYSSEQTKQLLEQARQFSENAESEKDAKLWSELEQSLNIQLKDDEKREKREGTFLGKASDFFAAPEKEQVEYTPEEQKGRETLEGEYNRLKAQYQEASAYATDPAQLQELDGMKAQLDALEQQIKDDNRAHGREVYDGLGADTRAADAFEGWAGGRAANVGAVAGTILNWVDSASDDMVRYEYDQEHGEGAWDRAVKANPELENYLDLGETGNRLMEGAQANKVASDQLWSDYQEDMSGFGKLSSNVVRGGADLALNAAENAFVPGSGAFSMYMQAAGGGALEQAGRENNDPDSVAAAAVVRGVGAWFSNRLVGGVEAVYGKSVLGGIADNLIKGASPAAQKTIKTLLNSEGIEEGLEDMLNYAADRILGLDGDASLDWNEVKQDAMIGYILGVLTNGLAGGMNYDQAARHRIVDGGIEAAESGLAPQEIERIARESTKEDVVIKPGNAETSQETENVTSQDTGVSSQVTPEQATEMAQSQTAALEGQGTSPQAAPAPAQAPAASGPAADASKPYEGPQLPGASYGGGDTIDIGGDDVSVHYAVIPASQLNMSNDIYGNVNPNYPAELQPRDRTRTTSQASALKMVAGLKPYRLGYSADGQNGAPVVRSDGVVLSGNLRSIALREVYNRGGEKAGEYQDFVRRTAANFGIDPNTVPPDGVLVRVVDGEDHDWQKLAKDANVATTTKLSATEQATVDSERLLSYPELMSMMVPNDDGNIDTAENKDFINAFLQDVIPSEELNDVWDNKLTQNGEARVKYAIFQTAYGDADLMKRLSESRDDNMKNVSKALLAAAPKVASLENGVQNGTRYIGVREQILNGVKLFERAKEQGASVENLANQASMDAGYSAETVFIAKFLEGNKGSTKQIRTFLSDLADTAENYGDPQANAFFGEADIEPSSRDVLEGAIARYEQETGRTIGRPDYDFYGTGENLFDLGTDRTSESGTSTETDTDAGSPTENPGEAAGSGADGRLSELANRMLAGEVSDEEYLSLLDSEEGRAQLAEALGIQSTDKKDVAAGLSIYLLYQDQLRQSINQTTQTDETVVDNLLGEEPEAAPEPATEPATEAQENPEEVNSQPEETNASEGVLNTQEAEESTNPFFQAEETTEPEPRNVNENVDTQRNEPPQNRREKISQYFTNTLTESGRARGLDPITYNPTSEAESLTNAAMRLAQDKQALLDQLMKAPAWDNEMVDAAWLFENELYKQYLKTGDSKDLNAWKRIQTYKISQTAKGLQAVAKQSRPTAAAVLEASMNQIEDFKAKAKPGDQKAQQAAAKAEKNINSVARELGTIENAIDDLTDSGMSETEARETLKGDLIDLSVKINQMRGVSMFGDMANQKQQKKFRKLLGEQDAEFIQRFVACQAAGIAEDVAYKGKQDIGAQLNTFQKLAQLTGTGTWLRNLSGNASFGLIDILAADNPVTLVADQIMKAATGQRSTGFELGMMDKGVLAASKRAWNRSLLEVAANIDLAENQENTKYDMSRTRTNDPTGNLMRRALSRWEQWNGYMLTSSDKLFRGGIEQSVTNAIARANGWDVNNLTTQQKAQIRETAEQVADYRLFQNQGNAAKFANFLRDAFNLNFPGTDPAKKHKFGLGTMLTPYTTVPTNIGVKALEFSPANAVKGLVEMVKVASDAKNGTATMAKQNQAVTDFGRGATGTALIAGLAVLMKNWPFFKDWENEEDKDVKQQNKAEGKQGMQFNLSMWKRYSDGDSDNTWRNGDRTIDISSIEPLNQLLTAASLISEGEDFKQAVYTSARENFMQLPSVSALKNIEDSIRYTNTPDDGWETFKTTVASTAGGIVGGFIPAPLRHAASVTDESERDTSGNNQAERALNQIKSGIPGLRQTLPVKTDNYGNEISAGDLRTRALNTYGGQRHTQINQGDVSREAERLREATGEKLTPGRNGPSSEKFGGEKVKLTAEERKSWKDDYGQDLDDAVGLLMRSSIYRDADDELKAELWQNLEGYVKDGVKREFAEDHDLKHDSDYAYLDDVDNPVTFLTANKAFNLAEKKDDWDVVDTLIGPVGKLSEDERELMRDKNRTLMSYYDYLTPNARGNQVKDAATVHSYKAQASANAKARGVTSASGMDKYSSVVSGYRDKKFTDDDVDAFMTKQASDGDWEVTKGRAALYIAAREGGASVQEAFDIIDSADVDQSGSIDEKGYTQKAMHEGTNALKKAGVTNSDAMWYAFNEIMYPYKLK